MNYPIYQDTTMDTDNVKRHQNWVLNDLPNQKTEYYESDNERHTRCL
uniref:Uncharacterized protein n=1 Tax=Tetranychus urticae TaxID=32264 RepID=T1K4X0_TETUR